MALIEIRNVTKRYHKGDETITPLDDVSLNVEQGDFISLMGASGTGKSTLLNLIASIDKPDGGSIVIGGVPISLACRGRKLANWRAANLGYIFQTHNLVPVLTAYENIELPLLLLPMSRGERRRRVETALTSGRFARPSRPLPATDVRWTGTTSWHCTGDRHSSKGRRGRRAHRRS